MIIHFFYLVNAFFFLDTNKRIYEKYDEINHKNWKRNLVFFTEMADAGFPW